MQSVNSRTDTHKALFFRLANKIDGMTWYRNVELQLKPNVRCVRPSKHLRGIEIFSISLLLQHSQIFQYFIVVSFAFLNRLLYQALQLMELLHPSLHKQIQICFSRQFVSTGLFSKRHILVLWLWTMLVWNMVTDGLWT